MLVARVVHHQVQHDAQPATVRLRDEPVERCIAAEERIDRGVVADVVSDVAARRRVDRGEPQRVDTEVPQVVELGDDPGQVADPVAVAVGEAARVDLVR